jgi:hypothetical protein
LRIDHEHHPPLAEIRNRRKRRDPSGNAMGPRPTPSPRSDEISSGPSDPCGQIAGTGCALGLLRAGFGCNGKAIACDTIKLQRFAKMAGLCSAFCIFRTDGRRQLPLTLPNCEQFFKIATNIAMVSAN